MLQRLHEMHLLQNNAPNENRWSGIGFSFGFLISGRILLDQVRNQDIREICQVQGVVKDEKALFWGNISI